MFIENSYDRRQRLWPSVVRELELFRNLMPLATGNMRSGWASGLPYWLCRLSKQGLLFIGCPNWQRR